MSSINSPQVKTCTNLNEYGYTNEEILVILEDCKKTKGFNEERFWEGLTGNTCRLENGIIYTYPCDVSLAIRLGLENRGIRFAEWD